MPDETMTSAGDQPLRHEVADGVATLTLNRPSALNALDVGLKTALRDALREVAGDPGVRAVVLTGAGKGFCVGQDLREHAQTLEEGPDVAWRTVAEHYSPIVAALASMPKPVVAAVNGVAAGAGASFACACDFRVVADTAGFNFAFAGIGLACDSGTSWTLPRLVGWAKARELLLLPRTVKAEEAQALGLATSVVTAGTELAAAQELAATLAAGPTVAYGAIKRALAHAASADLDSSLALEGELMALTGATTDHREAVASFLGKQKPVFSGR
jgi:2-(1,2-epoxy-1,2-dihydrophenyl)acetyl-CoA isomerase